MNGIQRAGRLCFGSDGRGTHEMRSEYDSQEYPRAVCRAPITARFAADGSIQTTQPEVSCDPPTVTWFDRPNSLTCRRVSDTTAVCVNGMGVSLEFRRG
jgi:hypothetical protein